jgi:anti-sigma28 factor (negative regulator of flagellin synthesis)
LNGRDKSKVSKNAIELAKSLSLLKEVPDIRAEIVEKLKNDIAAGTYDVPIETIANILISKIQFDY